MLNRSSGSVGIDDFQFLKFIGEGAYGRIYLARKRATGDIFAIKVVDYADRVSFFFFKIFSSFNAIF